MFGPLVEENKEYLQEPLIRYSKRYVTQNVLQAWKFQQCIDEGTGGLNLTALENMRLYIEELEPWERGFFPSPSFVKIQANRLSKYAVETRTIRS